jgi:hypothetical protein
MYFPLKMLLIYATEYEDQTREIPRNLFDESKDISGRINETQDGFKKLEIVRSSKIKKAPANTFIGLRFISLLLGYRYPDIHNALKPSEWKVFAAFIDPAFKIQHKTSPGDQYKIYCRFIEPLREYIMKRKDIDEIRSRLTEGLDFKDSAFRWTTQDVIFVTAKLYATMRGEETQTISKDVVSAVVEKDISDIDESFDESDINTGFMPLEKYLEDYLVKNWDNIDFGEKLSIYVAEDGTTGKQYSTSVGVIDILAIDAKKNFVVIELKRDESGYQVVGQTLNYMGWVKRELAEDNQTVRGIIIVGKANSKLHSALSMVSDKISLKEYRVKMSLHEARI